MKRIKSVGDTEAYTLSELKKKINYEGSLSCFRVMCWRSNIPFAKGYKKRNQTLLKLIDKGYDFKNYTLPEIKKTMNYDGGLDGLACLLKRHEITWNKTPSNYPTDHVAILAKIKKLGDTSTMTPKEILTKIGLEIMNPSQYLVRINVPYKHKKRKST